jgi:hypothetical protein
MLPLHRIQTGVGDSAFGNPDVRRQCIGFSAERNAEWNWDAGTLADPKRNERDFSYDSARRNLGGADGHSDKHRHCDRDAELDYADWNQSDGLRRAEYLRHDTGAGYEMFGLFGVQTGSSDSLQSHVKHYR